jgi:hypothetical protein
MSMAKIKRTRGKITIYKTLHRKRKIDQHEPHLKQRVNIHFPEWLAVSVNVLYIMKRKFKQ